MIVCETQRLILREALAEDAPFVFALLNDPDFRRFIGDRGVNNLDTAEAYIADRYRAGYAQHGYGMWIVVEKASGAAVGMSGLVRREGLDGPDIGYAFLPAYRGKGYALESARAVLDVSRNKYALPRLLAITDPENERSHDLLLRLGFRQDGMVKLGEGAEALRLYEIRFSEEKQ